VPVGGLLRPGYAGSRKDGGGEETPLTFGLHPEGAGAPPVLNAHGNDGVLPIRFELIASSLSAEGRRTELKVIGTARSGEIDLTVLDLLLEGRDQVVDGLFLIR
jgi:hypothetical protein